MNGVDEQVHRLARVRDGQLAGRASGAGARALLASIIADTEPEVENRTPSRHRRFGHSSRWPVRLFIAGTAIAGLAAAAIVIPGTLSGNTASGKPPSVAQPSGTTDTGHLAARKFLLAAAATSMKEPAEPGRYWHSVQKVGDQIRWSQETDDKALALFVEFSKKAEKLSDKPEEINALLADYRSKVEGLRKDGLLPFSATYLSSTEGWYARKPQNVSRETNTGKVAFAGPADEEKWKGMGSPKLRETEDEPQVTQTRFLLPPTAGTLGFDSKMMTKTLEQALPADKAELEKFLRAKYDQDRENFRRVEKQWDRFELSFSDWLFSASSGLLAAPLTPGARAVLYQLLAEQPGITSPGKVTDVSGRTGVALTRTGFYSPDMGVRGIPAEYRLVVDEKTAELLSYEVRLEGQTAPVEWRVYENIGWVDKIGDEKTAELLSDEVRLEGQTAPVERRAYGNIGWVDKIGDFPQN